MVDNCPASADGRHVRDFVTNKVGGGRYIAAPEKVGTAEPREFVFREAAGQAVLCIDAHVLIAPGAIRKLIEFYDADPACRDLLHGPMLTNDNKGMSTHMEPVWRCEMFGVWGSTRAATTPTGRRLKFPCTAAGS